MVRSVLLYLRPWAAAFLLMAGCASSPPPEPENPVVPSAVDAAVAASTPADAPAGPKRAVPEGHLRREDVLAVLSDGVPSFLQKVEVEPVMDRAGAFVGWRLMAVRDPGIAQAEILPGDVILRVNGQPIENPYQFFDVFQSLAFAPELKLLISRGSEQRDLRFPISDDPSAPPLPRPTVAAPPPSAAPSQPPSMPPPGDDGKAEPPKKKGKKKKK